VNNLNEQIIVAHCKSTNTANFHGLLIVNSLGDSIEKWDHVPTSQRKHHDTPESVDTRGASLWQKQYWDAQHGRG